MSSRRDFKKGTLICALQRMAREFEIACFSSRERESESWSVYGRWCKCIRDANALSACNPGSLFNMPGGGASLIRLCIADIWYRDVCFPRNTQVGLYYLRRTPISLSILNFPSFYSNYDSPSKNLMLHTILLKNLMYT